MSFSLGNIIGSVIKTTLPAVDDHALPKPPPIKTLLPEPPPIKADAFGPSPPPIKADALGPTPPPLKSDALNPQPPPITPNSLTSYVPPGGLHPVAAGEAQVSSSHPAGVLTHESIHHADNAVLLHELVHGQHTLTRGASTAA